MGSGAIFREVIAAADILKNDFDIHSDIWSVLGINQLHREGMIIDSWNRSHPGEKKKLSHVEEKLKGHAGPAIISTDYVQAYAEQIRRLIPNNLTILGTDGFGRSDSREKLRDFFGVDRYHVVIASLKALADQGDISMDVVKEALEKYKIDSEAGHPVTK